MRLRLYFDEDSMDHALVAAPHRQAGCNAAMVSYSHEETRGTMRAKSTNPNTEPLPASQPASWISKTSGVCGGDACIRGTRHTVWGLVEWRQLGLSDAEILRHVPDMSQDDLEVAWGYDEQHREEIDQAIRENEEA